MSSMRPIFSKAVYSHAKHIVKAHEWSWSPTHMLYTLATNATLREGNAEGVHKFYRNAQTSKTLFQYACCSYSEVTIASSLPSVVDDTGSDSSDAGSWNESRASMLWSRDIDGDCQCDLASKGE